MWVRLAVLVVLAGCDQGPKVESRPVARPVRVQMIVLTETAQSMTLSGTVQARRQAELGFRVGGKVTARLVDAGVRVKAGAVLARLDPADLRLSMEAAASAVAAAEADAAQARAEFRRYGDLGRGSPAYVGAEFDRRQAQQQMTEARVAQARRQFALAQSQLGYGTLVTDADGIVTAIGAEVGQVVTAGQPVVTLARTDETDVVVDVPENRLGLAQGNPAVEVALWSAPDRAMPGRVREVGGRADPASRTYAVRVALNAPAPLGATATVRFSGGAGAKVAVVPASALVEGPAVWVLDPAQGRAGKRAVTVAAYRDDMVVIAAGLAEGEQVITAGATEVDAKMALTAWAGAAR